MMTGVKERDVLALGETLHALGAEVEAFPGFVTPQPMVWCGLYPYDPQQLIPLQIAMEKLTVQLPSCSPS